MHLSNRIYELAESKLHFTQNLDGNHIIDFSSGKRDLKLSVEIEKGRLSRFSYTGNPGTLEQSLFEAFGRLNENVNFWEINGLNTREMKNYLQDKNDEKAFSSDFDEKFEEILSIFPIFINKIFIKKVLSAGSELSSRYQNHEDLGEKLQAMEVYFKTIVLPVLGPESPLGDIYQWDAPNLCFVKNGQSTIIPKTIIECLEEIYTTVFQLSPLKVVAVEEKTI